MINLARKKFSTNLDEDIIRFLKFRAKQIEETDVNLLIETIVREHYGEETIQEVLTLIKKQKEPKS